MADAGDADKDEDADILPRFKGIPNVSDTVDDIYEHLMKRHVQLYPEDGSHMQWIEPKIVVLFATGNWGEVIDKVVEQLVHPFGTGMVASILVQEPLRNIVMHKLRSRMMPMDERIVSHPNFLHTLKMVERMHCRTVHIEEFDASDKQKLYGRKMFNSPIIVLDFPQIYFDDKPTAMMTLNTFRNLNEAVKLIKREGIDFDTISVYTNKLSEGYDMVSSLAKYPNFRFNCIDLPFAANAMVSVKNNYHYEVLAIGGELTTVAFPVQYSVYAS